MLKAEKIFKTNSHLMALKKVSNKRLMVMVLYFSWTLDFTLPTYQQYECKYSSVPRCLLGMCKKSLHAQSYM